MPPNGNVFYFGQDLAEAEKLAGARATDRASRIARPGLDREIKLDGLRLDFDTGRLVRINFAREHAYSVPLTPYPEPWKNFPEIEGRSVRAGMPRADFLSYLDLWEARAISLGAQKIEFTDLAAHQFAVTPHRDTFIDAVAVNMGISRRAGGGGIWCDGWFATFETREEGNTPTGRGAAPSLESLSAFRDEFNTVARRS